jgi:hypothetical protein
LLAESLHQNLVRLPNSAVPESVHLQDWLTFDPVLIDDSVDGEITLVRQLTGLGQAARRQAGLDLYRPLTEVTFWVPEPAQVRLVERYAPLLAQELNIKTVFALMRGGPEGRIPGEEDGGVPPGLVVLVQGDYAAALKTDKTAEMEQASLAGELVRQVSILRDQASLEPEAPLRLSIVATRRLAEALIACREYILADTLAVELLLELPEQDEVGEKVTASLEFSGEKATIHLIKAVSDHL